MPGAAVMMAMLAWGIGGAAMLPLRPRDEFYEPTSADKERLRLAGEKRQRKADRKAENTRRAGEGKPPIDPKLSDGGGWRDGCAGEGGGAANVTAGAVRCSAWLGAFAFGS